MGGAGDGGGGDGGGGDSGGGDGGGGGGRVQSSEFIRAYKRQTD